MKNPRVVLRENLTGRAHTTVRSCVNVTLELKYPLSRSDLCLVSALPTVIQSPGEREKVLSVSWSDSVSPEERVITSDIAL